MPFANRCPKIEFQNDTIIFFPRLRNIWISGGEKNEMKSVARDSWKEKEEKNEKSSKSLCDHYHHSIDIDIVKSFLFSLSIEFNSKVDHHHHHYDNNVTVMCYFIPVVKKKLYPFMYNYY